MTIGFFQKPTPIFSVWQADAENGTARIRGPTNLGGPNRETGIRLDPCRIFYLFFKMRFGIVKLGNFISHLPLHSPFAIFVEYRMRLGIVEFENFGFRSPLHSPFTIFGVLVEKFVPV